VTATGQKRLGWQDLVAAALVAWALFSVAVGALR
jgi:hypothetical protein